MTNKVWIAVLLAAVTVGTNAQARGDDHRGWDNQRHDHWHHRHHHDHWRHGHWRHDHRPPPAYNYSYEYRQAPRYYEQPAVHLPLPPPPHEVLRDLLRGHR